jgi:hypothetical protein
LRRSIEGRIAELQEQLPAPADDPAPEPEAKGFDYDAHFARMEKLANAAEAFSKLAATAQVGEDSQP